MRVKNRGSTEPVRCNRAPFVYGYLYKWGWRADAYDSPPLLPHPPHVHSFSKRKRVRLRLRNKQIGGTLCTYMGAHTLHSSSLTTIFHSNKPCLGFCSSSSSLTIQLMRHHHRHLSLLFLLWKTVITNFSLTEAGKPIVMELFCFYCHLSCTAFLSLSLLLISKGKQNFPSDFDIWVLLEYKISNHLSEYSELLLIKFIIVIGGDLNKRFSSITNTCLASSGASGATFTFVNKCDYTVWPGILSGAGSPKLESTGFTLTKGSSRAFQAPTGWSGRFWGRTGCNFDGSGSGSCATGDCGSGTIECNGATAAPPATLAEITLGSGSQDFYDVSLVDGYNLPMIVEGSGGSSTCETTGCVTDLNRRCPTELKTDGGGGCKSACEAFGTPEYCCVGAYGTASTCKPSPYSEIFKSACPKSYSYAYDDATSTFTCTGADYTITFCPSSPR